MPRRRPPPAEFSARLIRWQAAHGRHDLPWQNSRDAYRIWVSEIMLQQTQVATVVPYFERFMARFPGVRALAEADPDDVLAHWAGLGYYARARNLHQAALRICNEHGGDFPRNIEAIEALPGIGRSTAAAIAVFAFGQRHAILDGNVKRVFARFFGIEGFPGERAIEQRMWSLAEELLPPARQMPVYIQAQMDLGATLCTRSRPGCEACPLHEDCHALRYGRVHELPTARPPRVLPHRVCQQLILRRGREVLLEKRPAPGIWGGLWSFPERPAGEDPVSAARHLGLRVAASRALAPVDHGFTHYSLTLHPCLMDVTGKGAAGIPPAMVWLDIDEARRAAVPKPVKRLLDQLAGEDPDTPGDAPGPRRRRRPA